MSNLKFWLFVACGIFALGLLLGSILPSDFIEGELADLSEAAEQLGDMSPFGILLFILSSNTLAFLMSFALAPILLIAPVLSLITNGWLITAVIAVVIEEQSVSYVIAGLLPHGIIEIPAYILAEAAALSFGFSVIIGILKRERRSEIIPNFKKCAKVLGIALLLLVPAAVIETFITPILIEMVAG